MMIAPAMTALLWASSPVRGQSALLAEGGPPALGFPWFPDRAHAFVWRNWELVDLPRMAAVLRTTPENVRAMGESMGLPAHVAPTEDLRRRSYITTIRRNWHLLPYEQLLTLLDWTPEHLAHTLREDDFLWVKLGSLKPTCAPLTYSEPTEAVQARCAEIKAIVRSQFADELAQPARPRFDFIRELSAPRGPAPSAPPAGEPGPIRLIYSYFAVYGDPLSDPTLDPYPDGLLERLAEQGVSAVWLHTVLRDLAPGGPFQEFGAGHEKRLEALRVLVSRARRHGIRVFMYMNEPRAMPLAFFNDRPDMRGVQEGAYAALCTSNPLVRQWIADALAHVFSAVPDLGGVFSITGSENLTTCASHYGQAGCPRCSKRTGPEIIAEINRTFAEGLRRGSPTARLIAWDWGWPDDWAEPIIQGLPAEARSMSVSEWSLPITRGGIASAVGEYSISSVGPGPRARRHWALAQARGLQPMAKVQVNTTWELSAVPYLPVMELIAEHMSNLARLGVRDIMLSWTVGGYPSPNLRVARLFAESPGATPDEVLQRIATDRYGAAGAPGARRAWAEFSAAFREFPFHPSFVYNGPMQCGPANPLYVSPTGYRSTMVGIPYDDVDGWRAVYPPDVLASQLEKVAAGWTRGVLQLGEVVKQTEGNQRKLASEDLMVAEAAGLHFASAAAQVRFIISRNALQSTTLPAGEARLLRQRLAGLARDEIARARRLFTITRQDSRIGFEASNHYYYLPLDLVEKVVQCSDLLGRDKTE